MQRHNMRKAPRPILDKPPRKRDKEAAWFIRWLRETSPRRKTEVDSDESSDIREV